MTIIVTHNVTIETPKKKKVVVEINQSIYDNKTVSDLSRKTTIRKGKVRTVVIRKTVYPADNRTAIKLDNRTMIDLSGSRRVIVTNRSIGINRTIAVKGKTEIIRKNISVVEPRKTTVIIYTAKNKT